MKKVIVLMILSVFFTANVYALPDTKEDWLPEKPEWMPDLGFSTSFSSKYIWRGWNLGDRPVMQLDGSVSKWGFTFDWWANYSLNSNKNKDNGRYQEFTEIDYTIDYTLNVGEAADIMGVNTPDIISPLSIYTGYTYYTFPNADWKEKFFDTHEVYLGVSYDMFLQPFFTWYWDLDSGKGNSDGGGNGSYFLFGIGHAFDFGESGISAAVGMTTGYNNQQWTDKTGWADMVFSGEVNIPVFNYFTITPNAACTIILDKNTYNGDASSEFYGGVTIRFEY